jgi:hypothetical protein
MMGGAPTGAAVRATDAHTGEDVTVTVVPWQDGRPVIELIVADQPRLLFIG